MEYIFESRGHHKLGEHMSINDQVYLRGNGSFGSEPMLNIRKATLDEIQWLNNCIAAGKFVKGLPQVIESYEIY